VTASDSQNTELFWAMRGAGGNFGVALAFEFEVDEVGQVGFAQLTFDASDTEDFLVAWGAAVEASPRDLTSFLYVGGSRPGQPQYAQVMAVVDSDDPDTIIERLQPFAQIAPLVDQSVELKPYAAVMANAQGGPHQGSGEPVSRSGLVEHITPAFASAAAALIAGGSSHFFSVRACGGAVNDVEVDATAYAHRTANFSLAVLGSSAERLDAAWAPLKEHSIGSYLSFETGISAEDVEHAFPPATLERLRALKVALDPANLFRDNFNVVPAAV